MEYGSFQAEEFGDLQRLVDGLFYDRHTIDRLDLIVQAEILDLTTASHFATSSTPPWPPTAGAPSTAPWNKPSHLRTSPMTKTPLVMVFTGGVFKLVCALTRPWARGVCRPRSCRSCQARPR